jgi:hypothetical protein
MFSTLSLCTDRDILAVEFLMTSDFNGAHSWEKVMRLSSKAPYALTIVTLAVVAIPITAYWSRSNVTNASGQNHRSLKDEVLTPFNAAPEDLDPVKKQKRVEKNKRFNKSARAFTLEEQEPDEYSGTLLESEPPALPLSSDLIIVGRVEKRQPYLSDNMTVVYTEVSIKPEQILKNESPLALIENQSLIVTREGGAVKVPSGKRFRYFVAHLGLPKVGHQYVLFLQRETEQDCKLVSAYELLDGKTLPLEDLGDREPYASLTETQFLTLLREKIAATAPKGKE